MIKFVMVYLVCSLQSPHGPEIERHRFSVLEGGFNAEESAQFCNAVGVKEHHGLELVTWEETEIVEVSKEFEQQWEETK